MSHATRLVNYARWSKRELYERAKALGIYGRSSMTKGELVYELNQHCPTTFARFAIKANAQGQLMWAV